MVAEMPAVRREHPDALGTRRINIASANPPSSRPESPVLSAFARSKNMRPFETVPSAATSYRIQNRFFSSEFETYSVFSSGDSAIPFGRLRSFTIAFQLAVFVEKYAVELQLLRGIVVLSSRARTADR